MRQSVILARRSVRAQRRVVIHIGTGVAEAAAEGAGVIGREGAVHEKEAHAVRAVAAAAAAIAQIADRFEDHLQTRAGWKWGAAGDDAARLCVPVGEAQRAEARRVRRLPDAATRSRSVAQPAVLAADLHLVAVVRQSHARRNAAGTIAG